MEDIKIELEAAIALAEKKLKPDAELYAGCKAVLHLTRKFYEYMESKVKDEQ